MILIKNTLKVFTAALALAVASVSASDILVDTTISDAIGDANGGSKYEIQKMDVQWVDDTITVDVHTNFVEYNNRGSYYGGKKLTFGDLLISTGDKGTAFDYAFILTEGRDKKFKYTNSFDSTGTLAAISSTVTSKEHHSNSSSVANGQIRAGEIDTAEFSGRTGDWSANKYSGFDVISFSFNVNGIEAFQNASQLAFSWGMSCANDIVSGLVDVTQPGGSNNSIPEPSVIILMLTALGFLANRRRLS